MIKFETGLESVSETDSESVQVFETGSESVCAISLSVYKYFVVSVLIFTRQKPCFSHLGVTGNVRISQERFPKRLAKLRAALKNSVGALLIPEGRNSQLMTRISVY